VTYTVLIDRRAVRVLESLPKPIVQRIDKAVTSLANKPRPVGVKRLRGKLTEGWRIRIGQYRVLYRIDDLSREVRMYDIGHRREIYR